MHVMLLSTDVRFRSAASLLLTRRGCAVSIGESVAALLAEGKRSWVDVVVIDGGGSPTRAARLAGAVQARSATVGVVLVGDRPGRQLEGLRMTPKWGPFEELFAAVEQAMPTAEQAAQPV